ncbi:MAG TPA: hypothetical protein DCQ28_09170 [Bacteroidetes bacterium]|nr:hypothetical protein [Bacteroidota bacterium]
MKQFIIAFCCIVVFSSCAEQIVDNPPPNSYELKQNFPNPFSDSTTIKYSVPQVPSGKGPHLKLVVYDRFNRRQVTLMDVVNHNAGTDYSVVWNGNGVNGFKVPTGIYYILLMQGTNSLLEYDETEVLLRIAAFKK